jgi:hypothetical protein
VAAIKEAEAAAEVHHMAAEVEVAEDRQHSNNNMVDIEAEVVDIEEEAAAVVTDKADAVVVAALQASNLGNFGN